MEKGRQMLPFFFCGMDAIDGIDVFECPVPVRESVIVLSVPCEREGESLGSLRNIGKLGQRPKRAKRPKRHRSLHITIVIVAVSGLLLD